MIAERAAPVSVEELSKTLAQCNGNGTAVAIEGGGTLRGMGSTGLATGVTLTTKRFNRMLAHEFHDLTCSAQSGITLAALADHLGERGQFIPIDAPLRRKATIGGTMAAGWLGPRRHLYGRSRDFVIGSQVALADGTIANAGGMVVKNVSGYDMSKLYIGSFGTLGVITRLNFKTLPLPQRRRVLIATLPERSRARVVAQLAALTVTPAAACCVEGFRKNIEGEDGIDGRVLLLLEGSDALLDRATRDLRSALGRAGVPETTILDNGAAESLERVLDAQIATLGERSITYRSLGLPETGEERARNLRDAANRHELFTDVLLDVMNGDAYLRVSQRDSRAFAEKIEGCDDDLRAVDPHCCIVAGDAPIRAALDAWGAVPATVDKMRSVKARFDPKNTLNPGRFVGGI